MVASATRFLGAGGLRVFFGFGAGFFFEAGAATASFAPAGVGAYASTSADAAPTWRLAAVTGDSRSYSITSPQASLPWVLRIMSMNPGSVTDRARWLLFLVNARNAPSSRRKMPCTAAFGSGLSSAAISCSSGSGKLRVASG